MAIVSYRVYRANGLVDNLNVVETNLEVTDNNPLPVRRSAINFAKNLFAEIQENREIVNFNPDRPIQRGNEAGMDITVSVVYDDGNETIIYGSFLEHMLENWVEEAEQYIDNGYDTDGALIMVDATICYLGFISVLRDDYEAYGLDDLSEYFPDREV